LRSDAAIVLLGHLPTGTRGKKGTVKRPADELDAERAGAELVMLRREAGEGRARNVGRQPVVGRRAPRQGGGGHRRQPPGLADVSGGAWWSPPSEGPGLPSARCRR